MTARVIVEADGGSRGNPGPASYGALIRDADTGAVIAQRGETIGVATNNVAEYSGLIAGLELLSEHAPGAQAEVRMDSKLVIEQMAGRWKIKHPDMVPLAAKARRLVPPGTVWTWVPREKNQAADALANAALDDQRDGGTGLVTGAAGTRAPQESASTTGWGGGKTGDPTTLVLLRHGVTAATERKAFSGSGANDPELTETGRQQAADAARWLSARGGIDAIVASPMRRTRETAAVAAEVLGLDVEIDAGFIETSFGDWEGFTFAEIQERWGDELTAWLGSSAVAPPGGETFDAVYDRVSVAHQKLLGAYAGKTVLVVTHVTPIKMLVRRALGAPMSAIYNMELSPASITTITWWPDGPASLRNFNVVP